MVALKITNFGGMIPAIDDRLLPESAAALSQNTWLYYGTIEGLPDTTTVYTPSSSLTRKVYRIPITFNDKDHILDSYWMEFPNPDTDILPSPVADDSYERYYWASNQGYLVEQPMYNTRARIIAGSPAFKLGIPTPTKAPVISRVGGVYILTADSDNYYTTGGINTHLYYGTRYALDSESDQNGIVNGESFKFSYRVRGGRATLKYGTVVAGNRVTISDDGTITHGLPPASAQASPNIPTEGKGILATRAYAYTWVTEYGEESAPSPAALYRGYSEENWTIKVTAPGAGVTTNRNITTVRLYRTVTSSNGVAAYYQVGDFPIAQTTYVDSKKDDEVTSNTILPSVYWTPPPEDLEGWVMMPNGIMAGWRSNEIWFSEPYRPHAWPTQYSLNTDYKIVGLGVFGQTLVVCTSGLPYTVTGINPASMSMSRIASLEPCMSRGSIVSTIEGVLYASPNGLVLAAPGAAVVVTRQIVTKNKWLDLLSVQSLRATIFNNAYYCWGSVRPGAFQTTAFEPTAFLQEDFTGSYSGAIIDFTNQRVSWTLLSSSTKAIRNVWQDPWSGEIFLLRNGNVDWLDITTNEPHGPFKWRSRIFEMPNRRNMEAMRVWFTLPDGVTTLNPVRNTNQTQTLANDQYAIARVYADDRLVLTRELRTSGELIRMPSGYKSQFWQVEIEGRVNITGIEAATSAKELAGV